MGDPVAPCDQPGAASVPVSDGSPSAIVVVILAAGMSRRLGRPKQLLELQGVPVVRHVALRALRSGVDRVVVVIGAEEDRVRTALDGLAEADLLDVATEQFEIADLVVVVAGTSSQGEVEAQEAAADRWVDLSIALDARAAGSVVVGETSTVEDGVDVLASVRNDETAREGVSTVDNAGSALGQASTVHGLVEQRAGEVGQYGFADGADAAFAPVPAPAP